MVMTSSDAIHSFRCSQERHCTVPWDRHAASWRSRTKRVDPSFSLHQLCWIAYL